MGGPGEQAHVTFNLQPSRDPVVKITTTLTGPVIIQQIAPGDDLRKFGLVYFTLPFGKGTYKLTVSAETQAGCEDGVARPMTVIVQ